ncbi:hypothetical protein Z043_122615 [Scleropages formosus]|uniref:Uncharacterized protein n=1 Tax=Scleropages formosus TaxID=113540 RepID=A0A0P7TP54_SCLFO|nr:hypothetical protein Z043_122615 [Scleropages formosus]
MRTEQRLKEVEYRAEEQELQQDAERCDHPAEEPLAMQVQPAVNVNEKVEMSTKEDSGEEEVAISSMPKARVGEKEPSDALLPGVKCRVGSWNFEELIDQPVHPKAQSIAGAEGHDLIDADTAAP